MTPAVFNIIIRGSPDPDAARYCSATGASDRQNISRFFKGVKGLGLWDSSIFWMLPASQNFGTGTSVRSAGGLAPQSATLVNGPAWGPTGISTTQGLAQTATVAGQILTSQSFTYLQVANYSSFALNGDGLSGNTGVYSVLGWSVTRLWIIEGDGGTLAGPATGETPNSFQMLAGTRNQNTVGGRAVYRNGILNAALDGSATNIELSTGAKILSANKTEVRAFSGIVNAGFKAATASAFYALYKATIGQGLGLP